MKVSMREIDSKVDGCEGRRSEPPPLEATPGASEAPDRVSAPHDSTVAPSLPPALSLDSAYRQALRAELAPATALESILVDEMARHAAGMEFCGPATAGVLRFGARNNGLLPQAAGTGSTGELDAMFAAAVTTNALERVERFDQQHRRAFYRALAQLQQLRGQAEFDADRPESAFDDERACEMYLVGRMQAHPRRCERCGKKRWHYLKTRRRWECAACGAQQGLRSGTVMERSPLPLTAWFAAILAVCADLKISARDLAERIGLRRMATARGMLRRIRSAIDSPHAEELLAGLQGLDRPASPATGARELEATRNTRKTAGIA